jgi:hypothetical protein
MALLDALAAGPERYLATFAAAAANGVLAWLARGM